MSEGHWDLDQLQGWIGREATYTAPEPLGAASFRYYALAVGDDNPVYTDRDAARAAGHRDVVAPPTLVCETNQYVPHPLRDEHGYIGHGWDLPVRDCRLIRGGNRYEFHGSFHPDDTVEATWRIASVEEKSSRSGVMLVVESEAVYAVAGGDVVATNRETLIFQPRPGASS